MSLECEETGEMEESFTEDYDGASADERHILLPIFKILMGGKRGRDFLQKKASLQEFQGVAVMLIKSLLSLTSAAHQDENLPKEEPSLWARGEIQEMARRRPSEWRAELEKIKARGNIEWK